jgi:hypothetical protein
MKTQYLVLAIAFTLASVFSFGQKSESLLNKASIKVYGNCGTCKSRIEKAAFQSGVVFASWSEETQMLQVKFDATKTSLKKIQEKIASVGHDTQDVTATDQAYKSLPSCCRYDRKTTVKS